MFERKTFRGRWWADRMWALHLVWAAMALGFLFGGLWSCKASTLPENASARDGFAISGLLMLLFTVVPVHLWRHAARSLVLDGDGLRDPRGAGRKALFPYADIAFLGIRPPRGLVLEVFRDTPAGRMQFSLPMPRWAATHEEFLRELARRAYGMEVGSERDRVKYGFTTFVALLWTMAMLLCVGLTPALYLPAWRQVFRGLSAGRLFGAFGVVTVLLFVYQAAGVRSIDRKYGRVSG